MSGPLSLNCSVLDRSASCRPPPPPPQPSFLTGISVLKENPMVPCEPLLFRLTVTRLDWAFSAKCLCICPLLFVLSQRSAQRHRDLHRTMNILGETVKLFGSPVKKGKNVAPCEEQASTPAVAPASKDEMWVSPSADTRTSVRPSVRVLLRAFSSPLTKSVPKGRIHLSKSVPKGPESVPEASADPPTKTALRASARPAARGLPPFSASFLAKSVLKASGGSPAKHGSRSLTSPLIKSWPAAPTGTAAAESVARVSGCSSSKRDTSPWWNGVPDVLVRSSARARPRASSDPPGERAPRGAFSADSPGERGIGVPESPRAKTAAADDSQGPSPNMVPLFFFNLGLHCHAFCLPLCSGLCAWLLFFRPPAPHPPHPSSPCSHLPHASSRCFRANPQPFQSLLSIYAGFLKLSTGKPRIVPSIHQIVRS